MLRRLVLIPSYNTGPRLLATVRDACTAWPDVWVVIDGSTDGSATLLAPLLPEFSGLRVLTLPVNSGKGAAIFHALSFAQVAGFTHVLTMDADGQHAAASIPAFMQAAADRPQALILGQPVFDASAPWERLAGRKLANLLANFETLQGGIGDSLFGLRLYPLADLLAVMRQTRWMRRFDFEPEAAMRLSWRGLPIVNLPTPVRYFTASEGGVSHFNYLRDNILLFCMYWRLAAGFIWRLPLLLRRRLKPSRH